MATSLLILDIAFSESWSEDFLFYSIHCTVKPGFLGKVMPFKESWIFSEAFSSAFIQLFIDLRFDE